jgi:asparagine synthase (glutamine-hydrolysing)
VKNSLTAHCNAVRPAVSHLAGPSLAVSRDREPAGSPVVFAGRLDNRTELLGQLADAGQRLPGSTSDADLLLACHAAWGPGMFGRLCGDFALVLWDGRAQRLLCAVDALGQRPLFYHAAGERFVCGLTIRALWPAVGTPRLADRTVAAFLAGETGPADATFFADIHRLPAGHWLEVRRDGAIRRHRYWNPAAIAVTAGRSAEWYAEEFRRHFTEAVRARLPARGAVGLHVSGGFDSAAVAAVAHQFKQECDRPMWAFINTAEHPAANEARYQADLLARYPMPVAATAAEDYWAFRPLAQPLVLDEPYQPPYLARLEAELMAAQQRGISVILTGSGGDEVGGSSLYLLDRLLHGRLRRCWPECKARAAGRGQSPFALLWMLAGYLTDWARQSVCGASQPLPAWLNRGWVRKLDLDRPVRRAIFAGPVRQEIHDCLACCWNNPLASAAQAMYARFGVEMRHPFLDRRLFAWALAVPPFRLGENGRLKAPLRRALADLLPPTILARPDKGDYLAYWDLGIRSNERPRIEQMLARPLAAEHGFIDPRSLRRAYQDYGQGGEINRRQLWNALTLEAWLRQRERLAG